MNKTKLSTLLISAAVLAGGLCAFGEMKAITLEVTATTTNEVTTVTSDMRMTGLVRYVGVDGGAEVAKLDIDTVSGSGSSISAAKEIVNLAAVTDMASNVTTTVYLYEDFIRASCSTSAVAGSVHKIIILVSDP